MTSSLLKKNLVCRIILICTFLYLIPPQTIAAELHLALADSTCAPMKEAGLAFTRETGIDLQYSCKSSGLLARGIQAGIIQADFFISANANWMNSVVDNGLIDRQQVRPLLSNDLIIVTRADSAIKIQKLADLTLPEVTSIIIGEPSRAPFGRYAKQALQKSGLWDELKPKIISKKKISLAVADLAKAEEGTAAILYRTGLADFMRLQFTIPASASEPIEYYAAPLKTMANHKEKAMFLAFIAGDHFNKIFSAVGFSVIHSINRAPEKSVKASH